MKEALLVAIGGATGALFRYFMVLLFVRFHVSSHYLSSECLWEFCLRLALVISLESNSYPTEHANVGWGWLFG